MGKLANKIKSITQKSMVVNADEIEPGYTIKLNQMSGGAYLYWSEMCLEQKGALYRASNTEKLILAVALSIVDDEGKPEYAPDDYKALNNLPVSLLTRLIAAVLELNDLAGESAKK